MYRFPTPRDPRVGAWGASEPQEHFLKTKLVGKKMATTNTDVDPIGRAHSLHCGMTPVLPKIHTYVLNDITNRGIFAQYLKINALFDRNLRKQERAYNRNVRDTIDTSNPTEFWNHVKRFGPRSHNPV